MKRLNFLLVLFGCLFPLTMLAQYYTTQGEALEILKKHFAGRDVDYYGIDTNSRDYWYFFVDAEPLKGWEHECYRAYVSKNTYPDYATVSTELLSMPPVGIIPFPLEVKNRYGLNSTIKPSVKNWDEQNNPVPPSEDAKRTYALIISGGVNYFNNHERYWNDCSFIYQTLVKKYGVPKANIYPIMADGNDPGIDMVLADWSDYRSQSLDLDFDGVNELEMAATRANIKNTLSSLANKLNEDDHLFIYVIDHGGSDDHISKSYIWLWNYETLYDHELTEWLRPFSQNNVNINVVLGQCFSGGFVDNLKALNCVVATASNGTESSYGCHDIPYDEFVYQWTCAVNEANHLGNQIVVDGDNNGRVTMEEAFGYAKANDRQRLEHPMYSSTPQSVGEDLAFNHIAPAVDLFMRDNVEDTGKEPNLTSETLWLSPDMWIRNNADGIEEPENPYISSDHTSATIYVRIHNRGKADFDGSNNWLHVYWARAATALTTKAFKGYEVDEEGRVTGEHLRSVKIPPIKAGESAIVGVGWCLPWDFRNEIGTQNPEQQHFCLIGRIMNSPVDDGYEPGVRYFDVPGCNHHSQLNVSIIKADETYIGTSVHIRNITDTPQKYSLEFVPQKDSDKMLYNLAQIDLEMSNPIYEAWLRGGLKSHNLLTNNILKPHRVTFVSPESKIEDISLNADEFNKVTMRFNIHGNAVFEPGKRYTYNLIQRDENDSIIGGEAFIIEMPSISTQSLDVAIDDSDDETVKLSVNNGDAKHIAWFNAEHQLIAEGASVELPKTASTQHISVSAFDNENEWLSHSVTLESYVGIKEVSVNNNTATVKLKSRASASAELTLSSVTDATVCSNTAVKSGDSQATFDVSNLRRNAMYVITYRDNGEYIDSQKFTLE